MTTAAVSELLTLYREAPTLADAEQALHAIERLDAADELELGDLYDGLAEVAAEEEDFALAVRAQARALELGCEMPTLAREMLGWYLMKDGRRAAGEAEFGALRAELGDDPDVLVMLGNARADAGYEADALAAFEEAVAAAEKRADGEALGMALSERRESRERLGLPPGEKDRRAPGPRFLRGGSVPAGDGSERVAIAVAWFPREERAEALRRWPDLHDDLADGDHYCRGIDAHLRRTLAETGRRPSIAPLRVEELVACADRHGLNPGGGTARARRAAELERSGETLPWPPGRNERCWCGSGRKYKRCCGT